MLKLLSQQLFMNHPISKVGCLAALSTYIGENIKIDTVALSVFELHCTYDIFFQSIEESVNGKSFLDSIDQKGHLRSGKQ